MQPPLGPGACGSCRALGGLPAPQGSSAWSPQPCPFSPFTSVTVPLATPKSRFPEDRGTLLIRPSPQSLAPSPASGAQSTAAEEAPPLTDTASRCPVKVCRCWQLRASQIRMSLLRSPEACGDEDNGRRHPPCAQASHPPPGPTLPYEVLAVGGDGHAEDVAAVPRRLPLGPFLGSWDHVKLPSTLHAP